MGPRDIPDRWEPYIPIGSPVRGTRFIAFKVPLKEGICNRLAPKLRWTVDILLSSYREIGLIVDLTMTTRYYDYNAVVDKGVDYCKIPLPGQKIPPEHLVKRFFAAIDFYLDRRRDDSLIGIHCTHGVNRTGYMIARYLVQRMGYSVSDALECLTVARGHPIERDIYISNLGRNIEQLPKIMDGKDIVRGRAEGDPMRKGSKRPADKAREGSKNAKRAKRRWLKWLERKKKKRLEQNQILDIDSSEISIVEQEVIGPDLNRGGENQPVIRVRRTVELISCSSGSSTQDISGDVVWISSDSEDSNSLKPVEPSSPELNQRLVQKPEIPFRIRSTQELMDDVRLRQPHSPPPLLHSREMGNQGSNSPTSQSASHSSSSDFELSNVEKPGIPFRIRTSAELIGDTSSSCNVPVVPKSQFPAVSSNVNIIDGPNNLTNPPGHTVLSDLDQSSFGKPRIRIRSTTELIAVNSSDAPSHATTTPGESLMTSVNSGDVPCRATTPPGESLHSDLDQSSVGKSSIPFRIRTTTELMDKTRNASSSDVPSRPTTSPGDTLRSNLDGSIFEKTGIPFRIRTPSELMNETSYVPKRASSTVQTLLSGVAHDAGGRATSERLPSAYGVNDVRNGLVSIEAGISRISAGSAAVCLTNAKDSGIISDRLHSEIVANQKPMDSGGRSQPTVSKHIECVRASNPPDDGLVISTSLTSQAKRFKRHDPKNPRNQVQSDPHPKTCTVAPRDSDSVRTMLSHQAQVDVETRSPDISSRCAVNVTTSSKTASSAVREAGMQSSAKPSTHCDTNLAKTLHIPLISNSNETTTTVSKRPSYFYSENITPSSWSTFCSEYQSRELDNGNYPREMMQQYHEVNSFGYQPFYPTMPLPSEVTSGVADVSGSRSWNPHAKSSKAKCSGRSKKENEIIDQLNNVTTRLRELNQNYQIKKWPKIPPVNHSSDVIPVPNIAMIQQRNELCFLQKDLQRKLKNERNRLKAVEKNGHKRSNIGSHKSGKLSQARAYQHRRPNTQSVVTSEAGSKICYVTSSGELFAESYPTPDPRSRSVIDPDPVIECPDGKISDNDRNNDSQALNHKTECSASRGGLYALSETFSSYLRTPISDVKICGEGSRISSNVSIHGGKDRDALQGSGETPLGATTQTRDTSKPSVPSALFSDPSKTLPTFVKTGRGRSRMSGQVSVHGGKNAVALKSSGETLAGTSSALDSSVPAVSSTALSDRAKSLPTSDVKICYDGSRTSGHVSAHGEKAAVTSQSSGKTPLGRTTPTVSGPAKTLPASEVKTVNSDRNAAPPKLPWTALSDTSWDALYR